MNASAKKLLRIVGRIIPQCGMVSQAVAFNMFLAFFPTLLAALGLVSSSLRGEGGRELAVRFSAMLPPGSWQLLSDYLLHREVNPWLWVLLGWAGTLLIGSQIMKLIMEGIHMIYGDRERHSFLGRQLRGLFLFSAALGAWVVAIAFSVFGQRWRQWMTRGLGDSALVRGFWSVLPRLLAMLLAVLVLALVYRVARAGAASWRSVLPGAAVATALWWIVNLLFGFYVRKMRFGLVFGGLAAAIGLMVWMELSAMIIFLGAAWNAEGAPRAERLSRSGDVPDPYAGRMAG